jgi:hypothetical protein
MPKKMNVKKAAAGAVRAAGVLEEAIAGDYDLGIVRGKLGFKGFNVEIVSRAAGSKDKMKERKVYITSKVVAAQGRAERDTFLIVDGEEVQMIVAKQEQLDRLRRAGRVPEEVSGLAEYFEMEEEEQELETWDDPKSRARSNAERERMAGEQHLAEEIVARILAKRAGLLKKTEKERVAAEERVARARAAVAGIEEESDDDHEEGAEDLAEMAEAMGVGGAAAPKQKDRSAPNRAERRAAAERARAEAEAEAAAAAAELARLAALAEEYHAEQEAELREEAFRAEQARRAVPACWEDEAAELDIDAI